MLLLDNSLFPKSDATDVRAHRPKTKLFSVSIIGALGLVEGGGPKVIPEVPRAIGPRTTLGSHGGGRGSESDS